MMENRQQAAGSAQHSTRGGAVSAPPSVRLAALVVAGFVAAITLQVARDRWYPTIGSPVSELYFTNGESVGRMALSYKSLLADIYWIRAVQYFGSTRIEARNDAAGGAPTKVGGYDLLYPLLDVTTSLDPAFNIAYRFGSIFLAEEYPMGPGRPELAVKLLDKGFAANPRKWQYVYDKAFVYSWALHDSKQSAHWFSEAAKVPGSPEWMPGMAAFMLEQGGDRRSSRVLWQQIHDSAEHQYVRDNATFHLEQLDAVDAAEQLTAIVRRYEAETGSRLTTFEPLVARRVLPGMPTDADGAPFVIDPATGRVDLDTRSRFYPLPRFPDDSPKGALPH
jgi:hypothetical protein